MLNLTKPALLVALLVLGTAATFAICHTTATSTSSLWRLDGSIKNEDTGLRIGIETDLVGNVFGVVRVEPTRGTAAVITSAQLLVDGTAYTAVQQPDGSWRTTGAPASGVRNLRVEAVESGGALRYYEALGIK